MGLDTSKSQGSSSHTSTHSAVHAAAALLDREQRVRDKGQQQIREAIIQQQNRYLTFRFLNVHLNDYLISCFILKNDTVYIFIIVL